MQRSCSYPVDTLPTLHPKWSYYSKIYGIYSSWKMYQRYTKNLGKFQRIFGCENFAPSYIPASLFSLLYDCLYGSLHFCYSFVLFLRYLNFLLHSFIVQFSLWAFCVCSNDTPKNNRSDRRILRGSPLCSFQSIVKHEPRLDKTIIVQACYRRYKFTKRHQQIVLLNKRTRDARITTSIIVT